MLCFLLKGGMGVKKRPALLLVFCSKGEWGRNAVEIKLNYFQLLFWANRDF
jgi:hypothetical protein